MFCEKCGQQLEENARFCTRCGASTEPVTGTAPPTQQGAAANASSHTAAGWQGYTTSRPGLADTGDTSGPAGI